MAFLSFTWFLLQAQRRISLICISHNGIGHKGIGHKGIGLAGLHLIPHPLPNPIPNWAFLASQTYPELLTPQALEIRKDVLGEDHHKVGDVYNNMANIHVRGPSL